MLQCKFLPTNAEHFYVLKYRDDILTKINNIIFVRNISEKVCFYFNKLLKKYVFFE